MKILTLHELLEHLRLDSGSENAYVVSCAEAAEEVVEEYLNTSFEEMAEERGKIPQAIRHACYLIVADMYKNREASSQVALNANPAILLLLRPFKKLTL